MKRGLILFMAAMTVVTSSVLMWGEEPKASVEYAYYSHAKPVEVPYLDITIKELKERNYGRTDQTARREGRQDLGDLNGEPTGAVLQNAGTVEAGEDADSMPELVEPEDDETRAGEYQAGSEDGDRTGGGVWTEGTDGYCDELVWDAEQEPAGITYLGEWTCTAYCPGPCCCGEWATGCTASGVPATSNHTVACGILPFGTKVMIDDVIYTVEDLGVEGEWIDIFFDSHEEALAYGMQTKSVYLIEG